VISVLNLFRLTALFLVFLLCYPFAKNRAVYNFLVCAGPSFIKLGQILSVRADLVGEKLAATLAQFQDRLKPFCEKKLRKILAQEFGENFSKIFLEFNYSAVASASIAQVHKAKLIGLEN
jgi:ubiquinone biosynthesis protein